MSGEPIESTTPEAEADVGPLTPRKSSLTVLSTQECAYDPNTDSGYIVQDILKRAQLASFFGDPGSGKSVIVPDLGYCVAQGRKFCGKKTTQGRVLYTCNEDLGGTEGRIDVLAQKYGHTDDFRFVKGLDLQNEENAVDLLTLVQDWQPSLLVVDTLLATWAGIEENDSKGMGEIIRVCRSYCAHDCAVIVITHPAKNGSKLPRGHGSFHGTLELAVFLPSRPTSGVTRPILIKNKNGSLLQDLAFRTEEAIRGHNLEGDPVKCPIAVQVGGTATTQELKAIAQREEELTEPEKLALQALSECLAGQDAVEVNGARAFNIDAWKAAFSDKRPTKKPNANRMAFDRALTSLQVKERISVTDGLAFLKVDPEFEALLPAMGAGVDELKGLFEGKATAPSTRRVQ